MPDIITISASDCGTPKQAVVPANALAAVAGGVITFNNDDGSEVKSAAFKLPSAAGQLSYSDYFNLARAQNLGVLPTGSWDFSATRIATQTALSTAVQQEWLANPASGHNAVTE